MILEEERQIEDSQIALTKNHVGIGGWLILIIIRYFLGVFVNLGVLLVFCKCYANGTVKLFLDSSSEYYNPRIVNVINFGVIGSIVLSIAIIFALVLMFSKKRLYPKYAIGFIVFTNLFTILYIVFCSMSGLGVGSRNIASIVGSILVSIIWVIYFIKSERVKNTFIK